MRPRIGITLDNAGNAASTGRYEVGTGYSRSVHEAGGMPLLLPHHPELAAEYVALCDGIVLTGGVDPDTRPWGQPLHPRARLMDPVRQAFETALLDALAAAPAKPVLGICLGMQLMALHSGGRLNQYLPDLLVASQVHRGGNAHPVCLRPGHGPLACRTTDMVVSSHVQAVADPGRLQVLATAPDGVIEAIGDLARPFHIGVQWHPERAGDASDPGLNQEVVAALVRACRA